MNAHLQRSYRKNLTTEGLVFLAGEEQEVTVQNLSVSGVLARLNNKWSNGKIKDLFSVLSSSTVIDFYFPKLQLAGEAEVVRADTDAENHILLSLEFKNIAYEIDNLLYKRKAYRKTYTVPGRIIFEGKFHDFVSINVSVDGLMIRIKEALSVPEGTITAFEFKPLELEGSIKVIWVDSHPSLGTLMGLQYVSLSKAIQGIPRFGAQQ